MNRPDPRRRRAALAVAGALAAVLAAALLLPVVVVDGDGRNGGAGWQRIALPGTPVVLSHLHSVERTLVEDRFTVGWRGGLVHRGSVTRSHGAGLPAEGRPEDGVLVVPGTGQRHRGIPLRFGPENDPGLRVGGTELSLAALAARGRVTLRTERLWRRLPPLRYFVASRR